MKFQRQRKQRLQSIESDPSSSFIGIIFGGRFSRTVDVLDHFLSLRGFHRASPIVLGDSIRGSNDLAVLVASTEAR